MKCNLEKSLAKLPPGERRMLQQLMEDSCQRTVTKEENDLQEIWIKLAIIHLNTAFGFDAEQLIMFLGGWKKIYRTFRGKAKTDETAEYLQSEMDRIFAGNFPQQFLDDLKGNDKL